MKINYVPLEQGSSVIMGQSPESSTYNEEELGLPFFQGKAEFGPRHPIPRKWCSVPIKIAEPNDILLSVRAPVGPTNICDTKSCIGRGLAAIRVKSGYDYQFLWYYLRNIEHKITRLGVGSTFTAIGSRDIARIKIPALPIETQLKITSILQKTESAREKRKEAIRLADEFLKSVFLDMFGDPMKNSKKWETCKVIDVSQCIVPGRNKPKSFTGDIPWVTTDDLNHLGITKGSSKNIGLTHQEVKDVGARIIPKDSVIMTCVGDLGVISIVGKEFVMNQQLHAFICSHRINNVFLMFNLSFQKPYMYKMASSTTVPYMNKTICNSIPVILPPIELQNKFADIVQKVEKLKEKQRESEKELDNLFNSLMQRAFGGDLFKEVETMPYENKDLLRSWKIEYDCITANEEKESAMVRFRVIPPDGKTKSVRLNFSREFIVEYFGVEDTKIYFRKLLKEKESLIKMWGLVKIEECLNQDNLEEENKITKSDSYLKWAEKIEKGYLCPSSQQQEQNIYIYVPEKTIGFK